MTVEILPEGRVRIAAAGVDLEILVSAGPRIVRFVPTGGVNLFADAGDATLDYPGAGSFRFRGGHRLWAAPENPAVTYAPDDQPCAIDEHERGLTITAPVDAAGLERAITVSSESDGWISVLHEITNRAATSVTIAPWAITQLRTGGRAIMPIPCAGADAAGLQASASVVLWPYTDLTDPRLVARRGILVLESDRSGPPLKVGTAPAVGHLGYLCGTHLFVKRWEPGPESVIPDRGASAQLYVDHRFCELESLGRLATIATHESVSHLEQWRSFEVADLDEAVELIVGISS